MPAYVLLIFVPKCVNPEHSHHILCPRHYETDRLIKWIAVNVTLYFD